MTETWCSWDHYFIKQSFLKHGCNTKSSWHFLYPRLHLQSFKQANFCTRMRTEVRGKKGCGWRWTKIWLQTKLSSFFYIIYDDSKCTCRITTFIPLLQRSSECNSTCSYFWYMVYAAQYTFYENNLTHYNKIFKISVCKILLHDQELSRQTWHTGMSAPEGASLSYRPYGQATTYH